MVPPIPAKIFGPKPYTATIWWSVLPLYAPPNRIPGCDVRPTKSKNPGDLRLQGSQLRGLDPLEAPRAQAGVFEEGGVRAVAPRGGCVVLTSQCVRAAYMAGQDNQ